MAEQEEKEIIRRAITGSADAFRDIVSQNQSFLYSVAYRFLGRAEDAEDVVQESFIRMWKSLSTYRNEAKLSTWLYKIAVNLCLDVLKSSHRKQQTASLEVSDHVSEEWNLSQRAADHELQASELHVLIQEAASELTPKQKAVFILRDLEGLPVEEVSNILSMSAGNVKSNLYYARQQMSEKLKMYYQTTEKITSL
jgi:RNA polymerase sigma-70 factor (ECF subfamily)